MISLNKRSKTEGSATAPSSNSSYCSTATPQKLTLYHENLMQIVYFNIFSYLNWSDQIKTKILCRSFNITPPLHQHSFLKIVNDKEEAITVKSILKENLVLITNKYRIHKLAFYRQTYEYIIEAGKLLQLHPIEILYVQDLVDAKNLTSSNLLHCFAHVQHLTLVGCSVPLRLEEDPLPNLRSCLLYNCSNVFFNHAFLESLTVDNGTVLSWSLRKADFILPQLISLTLDETNPKEINRAAWEKFCLSIQSYLPESQRLDIHTPPLSSAAQVTNAI